MTDTDPMPFGKYKGQPMQDVPVGYLHWLWHNDNNNKRREGVVFDYIRENMNALKLENKDLLWT